MSYGVSSTITLGAATVKPQVKQTVSVLVNNTGTVDITVNAVSPALTNGTRPVCFGEILPGGPNAGTLLSGGQLIPNGTSYTFTFDMVIGAVNADSLTVVCPVYGVRMDTGAPISVLASGAVLTVTSMVSDLGL
jgi:isopentenyl phosphate kinase